MSDGMDCTCAAYSESECCCGADWTPQEVIDLRRKLAEREKQVVELISALEKIQAYGCRTSCAIATESLSATQDLSGLVLCEAKPVAWMREHIGVTNSVDTEIERATFTIPLYKARKA